MAAEIEPAGPHGFRDVVAYEEYLLTNQESFGCIETAESDVSANDAAPDSMLAFSLEKVLAPIRQEQELLPGVPCDAYTLKAGALASFKSTFLRGMLVSKATGYDVYGLSPRNDIEPGPVLLLSYEDSDWRIEAQFQRVAQDTHRRIMKAHGGARAREFLERFVKNVRRKTLTGVHDAGLVRRDSAGRVVPNEPFLAELFRDARAFTKKSHEGKAGILIGLDPLRLAIVGSQNDDDGADVVVHTLNRVANELPGSALIVASHTTKAGAIESADGYTGASYATSGSALYSQHARSNFLMQRLKPEEIGKLFSPDELGENDAVKQRVVKLTHGRLSHGIENDDIYLRMDGGVLERIHRATRGQADVATQMLQALPSVVAAIDKLTQTGVKASQTAIIGGSPTGPTKARQREILRLLTENGYLAFEGTTKDRTGTVTAKGRTAALAASKQADTVAPIRNGRDES